jgi:hypothetical protein
MTRSATDIMQDIIYAAVIDSIAAMKAASKGVPNTLLRDLNSIHANSTFADLPAELQAAINASVRAAFTRLLREGYSVSPTSSEPLRGPTSHRPGGPGRPPHPRGGGPPRGGEAGRPPRKDGDRRPPRGGRPGRGPRPGGK